MGENNITEEHENMLDVRYKPLGKWAKGFLKDFSNGDVLVNNSTWPLNLICDKSNALVMDSWLSEIKEDMYELFPKDSDKLKEKSEYAEKVDSAFVDGLVSSLAIPDAKHFVEIIEKVADYTDLIKDDGTIYIALPTLLGDTEITPGHIDYSLIRSYKIFQLFGKIENHAVCKIIDHDNYYLTPNLIEMSEKGKELIGELKKVCEFPHPVIDVLLKINRTDGRSSEEIRRVINNAYTDVSDKKQFVEGFYI